MRVPFIALLPLLFCLACAAEAPAPRLRVMPLGDSITQGNTSLASYRRALYHQAAQAGLALDFVGSQQGNHGGANPRPDFDLDHEGRWGWRVDQVLPHVGRWVETAKPQAVLIHLGTNDVYQGQDTKQTVREYRAMLEAIHQAAPEAVLFVAEILPADAEAMAKRGKRGVNEGLDALNTALAALVAGTEEGNGLPIPPGQLHWMPRPPGFDPAAHTADGVHPNSAGEERLAAQWLRALLAVYATEPAGEGEA